ncbi:hypothetical protein CF386_08775 [Paraphotobacterium marinum]|uniref:Fibronectin type-III domain-containing protein n=1 Tax=Paraphotobacterium marinum TaxID=1755811 RepID=A0A220VGS6_9GAMM|nr:hypothetical protein [Paraphotobacterium marinum]ASK79153.1 hypothetical protein CF386_08775 [Paraphotobacterium marinum]
MKNLYTKIICGSLTTIMSLSIFAKTQDFQLGRINTESNTINNQTQEIYNPSEPFLSYSKEYGPVYARTFTEEKVGPKFWMIDILKDFIIFGITEAGTAAIFPNPDTQIIAKLDKMKKQMDYIQTQIGGSQAASVNKTLQTISDEHVPINEMSKLLTNTFEGINHYNESTQTIDSTPTNTFYNPTPENSFFPVNESVISLYDNQQILWHDIDWYDSHHQDSQYYDYGILNAITTNSASRETQGLSKLSSNSIPPVSQLRDDSIDTMFQLFSYYSGHPTIDLNDNDKILNDLYQSSLYALTFDAELGVFQTLAGLPQRNQVNHFKDQREAEKTYIDAINQLHDDYHNYFGFTNMQDNPAYVTICNNDKHHDIATKHEGEHGITSNFKGTIKVSGKDISVDVPYQTCKTYAVGTSETSTGDTILEQNDYSQTWRDNSIQGDVSYFYYAIDVDDDLKASFDEANQNKEHKFYKWDITQCEYPTIYTGTLYRQSNFPKGLKGDIYKGECTATFSTSKTPFDHKDSDGKEPQDTDNHDIYTEIETTKPQDILKHQTCPDPKAIQYDSDKHVYYADVQEYTFSDQSSKPVKAGNREWISTQTDNESMTGFNFKNVKLTLKNPSNHITDPVVAEANNETFNPVCTYTDSTGTDISLNWKGNLETTQDIPDSKYLGHIVYPSRIPKSLADQVDNATNWNYVDGLEKCSSTKPIDCAWLPKAISPTDSIVKFDSHDIPKTDFIDNIQYLDTDNVVEISWDWLSTATSSCKVWINNFHGKNLTKIKNPKSSFSDIIKDTSAQEFDYNLGVSCSDEQPEKWTQIKVSKQPAENCPAPKVSFTRADDGEVTLKWDQVDKALSYEVRDWDHHVHQSKIKNNSFIDTSTQGSTKKLQYFVVSNCADNQTSSEVKVNIPAKSSDIQMSRTLHKSGQHNNEVIHKMLSLN